MMNYRNISPSLFNYGFFSSGPSNGVGCSTIGSADSSPSTPRLKTAVPAVPRIVPAVNGLPIWHVNSREAPGGSRPKKLAAFPEGGSVCTWDVPFDMVVLTVRPESVGLVETVPLWLLSSLHIMVCVCPASHTAPSSTPTTFSGSSQFPYGLKQATIINPRAARPLQRTRVFPVRAASLLPIVCRIHPRNVKTSVNTASPDGVMQSVMLACDVTPRIVERPLSTVTNPDPLSPGHSEAEAALAVI